MFQPMKTAKVRAKRFALAFSLVTGFSIAASSVASAQLFPFPLPGFGGGENSSKASSPVEKLPALAGDAKEVSVSGISAGAFMANQLLVAYSSSIIGSGSIAGGPWNCAEGSSITAQTSCMYVTSQLSASSLVSELKKASSQHDVDSIDNLKTARVYLFNSPADNVVRPPMGDKTQEFFSAFMPADHIKLESSIKAAHGFPTLDYGNSCGNQGSPYINNCQFDGAGELLRFIYGAPSTVTELSKPSKPAKPTTPTKPTAPTAPTAPAQTPVASGVTLVKGKAVASSLHVFDQTEFGADAMLDQTGWVYIPEKCRLAGANCAVHVALHGCLQSGEAIGDVFVTHAGYNDWAEGSNIIVIYPQTQRGSGNPNGCFDWFGYTGADYATKNGPQMKAIKAMIDRVLGS